MLRMRNWLMLALVLGLATSAASTRAQDKAKEGDKPKVEEKPKVDEKAAEKPAGDTDKVDIRIKFEKDKKVYQEMVTKTSQFMKVMGMEVNQTQEQTFYFSWELKDEDKDKNMTLVQRIEGVKLQIDIAGNPIKFDSSNPGTVNTALGEFFKQLIGTEFKITVDKDFKVTKFEGRDEFLKKLGQANQAMEPMLKKVLNDDALRQMADPLLGLSPGRPVGKGDTWTRESKLNFGPIGSYKNNYKYTLEKIEKGIADIKIENTMVYEAPSESGDGLPFRIKAAKLQSKDAGGSVKFDVVKGRIDSQEVKVTLSGELDIEIASTVTKVELKQDQSTKITTSDQPQLKKN